MLIEGLIAAAGLVVIQPGAIKEVPDHIGLDLVRAGIARRHEEKPIQTMQLEQRATGKQLSRRQRMEMKR